MISLETIEQASDEVWTAAKRARADVLYDRIVAWIGRNAPCVTVDGADPGIVAIADGIVLEAILRAVTGTRGVESQQVGPASVNYIDREALPPLTRAEMDELTGLCTDATAGTPTSTRMKLGY